MVTCWECSFAPHHITHCFQAALRKHKGKRGRGGEEREEREGEARTSPSTEPRRKRRHHHVFLQVQGPGRHHS